MLHVKIAICLAILMSFVIPAVYFFAGQKTKTRYKRALTTNLILFASSFVIASILMYQGTFVYAEGGEVVKNTEGLATGLGYLAAALSTGLACIGGGIAVASAASAALGAISEDSGILGKSMIFLGLAEGCCLYGLIISFMILGKL